MILAKPDFLAVTEYVTPVLRRQLGMLVPTTPETQRFVMKTMFANVLPLLRAKMHMAVSTIASLEIASPDCCSNFSIFLTK